MKNGDQVVDVVEAVRALNLPLGEYCVVGGALFEVLGIRLAQDDIDVLVTEPLFKRLRETEGWSIWDGSSHDIVRNGIVEAFAPESFKDLPRGNEYIRDAELRNGIPFIRLADMVEWKRIAGRPQDLADIELAETFKG